MATLELTIDDIGDQGDGIAHHNNETIFVEGALTGERVLVEIKESDSLVKRGELKDILLPSSWRTLPSCEHFNECGGCKLQHMNDDSYSNYKVGQLQRVLGNIDLPPLTAPMVTAAKTRRRVRLAATHTVKGVVIGFNAWRSKFIVNIDECPIMKNELFKVVKGLRDCLVMWLPHGESCDIQLTSLPDGIDMLIVGGPPLGMDQRQILAEMAAQLNISRLSWKKWDRSPPELIIQVVPLTIIYGGTRVGFPPGAFLQATEAGEEALIRFAQSACKTGSKVLDLFSGLGTFGLSMTNAKSVQFVDLDGPSIESLAQQVPRSHGKYSIQLRNLVNTPFTTDECNDYDLVIFDPPRAGARKQAEHLAKSQVPDIIGVSCNPKTFARDAEILIEGGYKIDAIQPVDQFLWSTHLECIAHFKKS